MKKLSLFLLSIFLFVPQLAYAQTPPDGSPTASIPVTANVAPQVTDLNYSLTSLTQGEPFPQNKEISYKITYSSKTIGDIPYVIEVDWDSDITDFVVGSATKAYGNVSPIVDLVNKKITWSIPSISKTSGVRNLFFKLKTNSFYTGTDTVSFNVKANVTSETTVTPDQTITQTYLYNQSVPTPTPTPINTPTTTQNPTLIPIPVTKTLLSIDGISIASISQSEANIRVSTSTDSLITVYHGKGSSNLDNSIRSLTPSSNNILNLSGLDPDSTYYFKVNAKDENGTSINSEIFTFKTAKVSEAPVIKTESLIVTSNDNILVSPNDKTTGNVENKIVLPSSTVFEVQFSLKDTTSLKSIQAVIRNKQVLAASTFTNEAADNFVYLTEIKPGLYVGKIKSMTSPGLYEIYARLIDFNGNVSEQKIADLTVTNKFKVLSGNTPIERAKILLSLYNSEEKVYKVIPSQYLQIPNPSYSNSNGEVELALPYGKYKAEVDAIGFNSKIVYFEINSKTEHYPVVNLSPQAFSFFTLITYYGSAVYDFYLVNKEFISSLAQSNMFFNLITLGAILILVFLTLISFVSRTHISIFSIPYYLTFKTKYFLSKDKKDFVIGKITDENKRPLSKAQVFIIDSAKNQILAKLKTNKLGEFYYHVKDEIPYKISASKKGFIVSPYLEFSKEGLTSKPLNIELEKENIGVNLLRKMGPYIEEAVGIFFELLLILSLMLEVFFTATFGFIKIAPFLSVSILNTILLFMFIYRPKKTT